MGVKTDSLSFNYDYTLGVGENGLADLQQAFYTLGGCQDGLSKLIQAWLRSKEIPNFRKPAYPLGGGENGLSVFRLVSHMLSGDQNGLSELLRASYSLVGGQNGGVRIDRFHSRVVVWRVGFDHCQACRKLVEICRGPFD